MKNQIAFRFTPPMNAAKLPQRFAPAALALLLGAGSAFAASQTWTNAPVDSTWTNINNWIGRAVPGNVNPAAGGLSGDTATFNTALSGGIGGAANPIANDATRCIKNLFFDTASCGAYVIGSPSGNQNQFWLTSGTAGGNVTVNTNVVNPTVIAADTHFRLPSSQNGIYAFSNMAAPASATLSFSNLWNDSASTRPITLTLDGPNTGENIIGPISDNAAGSGAILIVKQGTGKWVLAAANDLPQKTSASVVASVQVNVGTLVVRDPGALGAISAANLIVQSNGTLQIDAVTLNNLGLTLRNGGTVKMNGSGTLNGVAAGTTPATSATLATTSASDVLTVGNASLGVSSLVSGGAADTVLHCTGPGTIQLATANTYVGGWSVDSGTNQLLVDGLALSANLNLGAGGVLDVSPLGAITYTWSSKGLSASGSGTAIGSTAATFLADPGATVDLGSTPITLTYTPAAFTGDTAHPALYVAKGTLSCNGNVITVNNASGTPLGAGAYRLVHQQTGNIISSGGFVCLLSGGGLAPGLVAEIIAAGSDLNMVVSAYTPKNLVWQGGHPDNTWDRLITSNWLSGAALSTFNIYDSVTFNATGSNNPVVNLAGTLVPGNVTVDASAYNYAFIGVGQIAGGGTLTKVGSGSFSLKALNTYVGGTVISNGTLLLSGDNTLPCTGAGDVAIYSPGLLDMNFFSDTINALIGNGTVDVTGGAGSTLTVGNNGDSGTFSGVLKNTVGTLNLTKAGNGTETLTTSNSFSGNTTINAGTLRVSNPYALGTSAVVNNNGTLDLGTNLIITSLAGSGGTILNSGPASTNTLIIQGSNTTAFSGSIVDTATGKMALSLLGGTLRLNAANPFTNATIVGSGATLQLGNSPASLAAFVIASNAATLGLVGGSSIPGTPTSITTVDGARVVFTSIAEGNTWAGQFIGSATTTNRFTGASTMGGALSFSNFLGVVEIAMDNASNPNFRFNTAVGGGDNTTFDFQSGLVHTRDATTVRMGAIRGGSATCGIGGTGTAGLIGTWLIGGKNVDNTFHGYISGSNNLVKIGSGSLTLDGVTVVTNTDGATYTNLLYSPAINYSQTTTVSNGVLAVIAPNSLSNSYLITLAAPTAMLDASRMGYVSNQFDSTLTVTNSFVVTNGVLTLNAPQPGLGYVGQTLAGVGIVKANGVVSSGAINPGFSGAGGTLVISNGLSILGGATNYFDLSDDLTGLTKPSDLLQVQGDVTLSGSSVVAIGALNGVLKVGTYPLIKYSCALKNESGTVPRGPIPNFVLGGIFHDTSRATMVLSNGVGEVDLVVVSINSHNLTWTGDGVSNLWDVVTSVAWNDNGSPSMFYQLDAVTFDDSTVNTTVSLQGFLAPSAITVNTVTNYVWGGPGGIGGVPVLTKKGSGTLILTNGASTYSGGTVISNGVLELGTDSGGNQNDLGLGTGPVSINGATAQLRFGGNSGAVVNHFITNAITLNGGAIVAADGVQHLTNSTVNVTAAGGTLQTTWATKNLVLESPLTGTGTLTVSAVNTGTNTPGGQVILTNPANTFSGSVAIATNGNLTLVNLAGLSNSVSIDVQLGGALDVSGRSNAVATLTLQSGQTLKGNGVVRGSVVALSGSTVSPGASIGTLTITNSITLAGLTFMEIDRAASPNNSDRIVATNIIAGGTLTVSNLGAAPLANDSFQLFSKPISNSFATVNLPTLSGGLSWSNSLALNGRLTVVGGGVNATPTNMTYSVSAGVLTLSWPADHTGWRLLAQTNNLQSGISRNTNDWGAVPGSATTNKVSIPIDQAKPTEFYRMVYP
jgi:fibronectin-binding autotransporter adhesin